MGIEQENREKLQKARTTAGGSGVENLGKQNEMSAEKNAVKLYDRLQQARIKDAKNFQRGQESEGLALDRIEERLMEGEKGRTAQALYNIQRGPKIKIPYEVIKHGLYLRREVKQGSDGIWDIFYAFAFIIDFIDLFPFLGKLTTFILKLWLLISLWGYGRWKVRAVRFVLIGFDILPMVGHLPLTIISVAYTHHVVKKSAHEAKKKLVIFQEKYGEI